MPFIIPVVICAVALGWVIGQKAKPDSQNHVGQHFSKVSESPLDQFTQVIRSGQRPSAWLVSEAVRDAYEQGQWEIASQIATSFQVWQPMPQLVSEPVESGESSDGQGVAPSPAHEVSSPPAPVPQARSFEPPLAGLDSDAWNEFVTAMKDKPLDYADEGHVGMFYHNRKRLNQLGIKPETLTTEESQYMAFETDVMDHFNSSKQMISEKVADPVIIDGVEHSVSMSGVLALLKAAGPNNAKQWLESPDLRSKFPHTKQLFLKCNNLF